jgi:pregnancy-associated plasma protein-A
MNRGCKLAAAVAACLVGAVAGAGSAPAAEQGHNAADLAACNWATPDGARGIAGFDASTGTASTARGGRQREPVMSTDAEIDGPVPAVPANFSATVPVYVHVIRKGTTVADGNVPDSQIQQQITVLNQTFNGARGGADTNFNFVLRGIDRTTNEAWFTMSPNTSQERAAKRALHKGGPDALNIYTTEGGGFLGWAYFPKDVAGSNGRQYIDGIVIAAGSLPGGSIPNYNLGFTATHETGHWIGLYHTFQNGCSAVGDRIDDTPRQRYPTSGCPEGQDSCPEPGLDPIHNYMDYSYDACYEEFTDDQAERMQQQWLAYRAG